MYIYGYSHTHAYAHMHTCTHARVKLFITSIIFDKFVQLLSYSVTTVTCKFVT